MLQELRCRQLLAVAQFYDFGNVLYYINHFHLLVKLQAVLRSNRNGPFRQYPAYRCLPAPTPSIS